MHFKKKKGKQIRDGVEINDTSMDIVCTILSYSVSERETDRDEDCL